MGRQTAVTEVHGPEVRVSRLSLLQRFAFRAPRDKREGEKEVLSALLLPLGPSVGNINLNVACVFFWSRVF